MSTFFARVTEIWGELEHVQRLLLDPTGERRFVDDRPTTARSVDELNAMYEFEDPRLLHH